METTLYPSPCTLYPRIVALASQPISLSPHRITRLLALLEWWHLLSLDAPTVATLWAWSFARALHLNLPMDALLLLFSGTWILYVADRILDGLHQTPSPLRERHFFYMRHRTVIIFVAVPVGILLTWLVFAHMLASARHADSLLFVVACVYFCLVHLHGRSIERWFPKELIVALVFASATAVPAFARISTDYALSTTQAQVVLLVLAALFAALCWLNCVAIEKWEQAPGPPYPPRGQHFQLQRNDHTTRWGQRHLFLISLAIVCAAIVSAALLLRSNVLAALLCLAAALAAALFIVLDRSTFIAPRLRIAADAALLTPLLFIFVR